MYGLKTAFVDRFVDECIDGADESEGCNGNDDDDAG
jgi:hypothetical protein